MLACSFPHDRHVCMSRIRTKNTTPELMLRHSLWRCGFRYIVNDRRLPGKPDIVLPKYRTVIFVHGCFWHGHKGCSKYTVPKTNTGFWVEKIDRNKKRDEDVWRRLEALGWFVIIVWECELNKKNIEKTLQRVEKEIISNREKYLQQKKERVDFLQKCKLERGSNSNIILQKGNFLG